MPRVKDEKVATKTLLLLGESSGEAKVNTDNLLVADALCSLGDILSTNAQSNEGNLECSVKSEYVGKESIRQEFKTVPFQNKNEMSQIQQQVN
jgi:hypothetical protein